MTHVAPCRICSPRGGKVFRGLHGKMRHRPSCVMVGRLVLSAPFEPSLADFFSAAISLTLQAQKQDLLFYRQRFLVL